MTASRSQPCTASRSDGQPCRKRAIVGGTVCATHGGRSPQVKAAAARRVQAKAAADAVVTLGLPREVDPATALLEEVWRSAGHVAWLGRVVAELSHEKTDGAVVSQLVDDGQPSVWTRLYADERKHLAQVSKMALDAGVAQQLVDIAHARAAALIRFTDGLLRALGHDPAAPKIRGIVRNQLMLIAGDSGG